MNKRTEQVPFGHIPELRKHDDAQLLLLKPSVGALDDWTIIRFATRKALEEFNKKAGLHPVVYTQVPVNCAIYKHQSDDEARKSR